MRIEQAELHEIVLPLLEPFIIAGGAVPARRSLIVVLRDSDGCVGYGEAPPFELPFYSEETLASARDLLERVLLPRLRGAVCESPEAVDALVRGQIRGNPFARSAVETAAWDLAADRAGTGMAQLVAACLDVPAGSSVACGVALGIPEDRRRATLAHQVARALARGYRRVKVKVAPGWDQDAVAAARDALAGADIPLTVDANGSYEWPADEQALRALDDAGLLYIEQPLAPAELVGHARLAHTLRTPICVDETLASASHARQIVALDGPRVWNLKVHRVGGLTEACAIWRIAREWGAELWAGTMPETGIGSQATLAAAALPGFIYPSDLEPSERWYGRNTDVIKLVMSRDGRMAVPSLSTRRLLDVGRFERATRLITR
ncbi:MAG TPA: o-succinylbenzoate synthase [Gemmatimonadales bacterium]|nr:o-succinylbenzoate synthase [Gemmatimonadales bacterium]